MLGPLQDQRSSIVAGTTEVKTYDIPAAAGAKEEGEEIKGGKGRRDGNRRVGWGWGRGGVDGHGFCRMLEGTVAEIAMRGISNSWIMGEVGK